ncbi:MAG: PhzF family phenazine biosynthesis protein [Actinobacteria bacterium]|nr:PhzF family phenazine biosynthesis protein [Actinomycetota bacterium]
MHVPFRIVDVFTDRPLAGNQLCVIPEPAGLSGDDMLALAREIGFSETTVVTQASGDRYAMRIFTPGGELPFAGHPTLGTAFVLAAEGLITTPATQVVAAGEFLVEVDLASARARMHQHPPEFGPEVGSRPRVAAAVGLPVAGLHPDLVPLAVSTGLRHLIVPAADAAAVEGARPDFDPLQELVAEVGADGLYLFAMTGDRTARARFFAPELGISEDPATGSAAGPLGAYLSEHGVGGMPGRLLVLQGEEVGRPSLLEVDVDRNADAWHVVVGGGVFVVGRGAFEL